MPELPVSHFWLVILYILCPSWYQRTQRGGQAAPLVRRTGRWWNRTVPNLEANTAQFLLLPRERVCKSVIRDGRRPRGMGGPPKAGIWMPTYLAPALQGAACKCFRGRASCGLWFRELTQIVSEPFFYGPAKECSLWGTGACCPWCNPFLLSRFEAVLRASSHGWLTEKGV